MKSCPRCGTPAPFDAPFCNACGHQYRTKFQPQPDPNQTIPQFAANPTQAIPGQYPAPISFGKWARGWLRYLLPRVALPVALTLLCIWGYGKISNAINRTLVGNWEEIDSGGDSIWVLNRDGTGWIYDSRSPQDYDIKWRERNGKLITYRTDNTRGAEIGYGLSDDGRQLTLRIESRVYRLERMIGEPPPRPSHSPDNGPRQTTSIGPGDDRPSYGSQNY